MPKTPEGFQPSAEDQAKIKNERTMSDAELLKGGAEYVLDEGATEPRLELTREQTAAIELEMRSDFEKTKDYKEEKKKALEMIFATLDANPSLSHLKSAYRVSGKETFFKDPEDEKRYNLEQRLRSMSENEIEEFLRALQTEQCYVTSHKWDHGIDQGEKVRLWLKPPIRKDYPDWGSNPGGGLAEGGIIARTRITGWNYARTPDELEKQKRIGKFGRELVGKVTEGEEAAYDLIEEVVIKDEQKKTNPFDGPAEYTRWLLKKKAK